MRTAAAGGRGGGGGAGAAHAARGGPAAAGCRHGPRAQDGAPLPGAAGRVPAPPSGAGAAGAARRAPLRPPPGRRARPRVSPRPDWEACDRSAAAPRRREPCAPLARRAGVWVRTLAARSVAGGRRRGGARGLTRCPTDAAVTPVAKAAVNTYAMSRPAPAQRNGLRDLGRAGRAPSSP